MVQPHKKPITVDEYFGMEEADEFRNEYYHGEIFAMTGASFNHNLIAGNIFACCHEYFQDSDCYVFMSDMRVQVDPAKHYTYPDLSITCGDIDFVDGRDDTVSNPVAIIEILSESTRDYDRGSKFKAYRKISSLTDYILVDQYSYYVEYFYRNEHGKWVLDEYDNVGDVLNIQSINLELSLNTIYDRVTLSE
jgi:Uma2 family endonuclease